MRLHAMVHMLCVGLAACVSDTSGRGIFASLTNLPAQCKVGLTTIELQARGKLRCNAIAHSRDAAMESAWGHCG